MSLVRTNTIQIGQSGTVSNNFIWYQPLTPDGTVRLANGVSGNSIDVMVVSRIGSTTVTSLRETRVVVAASNIDLSLGNYFTRTISGATTLTVSNIPVTGTATSFIFDVTNGGSAAITWWANVKWVGGTAPTLTASGRDSLGFYTYDAGSTWTGLVLGKDIK
jgi:hypothetical protein